MAIKRLLSAAGESFKSFRLLKWRRSWKLGGGRAQMALQPQVYRRRTHFVFLDAFAASEQAVADRIILQQHLY